ncbi:MAG: adenylyl-sulfate kinase [Rhodospirillales bacterium]|jgi:bifunctional enzyme CysN/CysC|nr:adenylyl-sulfate kinase [Rhodospirillales bacterium]
MTIKSANITPVVHGVAKHDRWAVNSHRGGVIWFTGLSGSGKTTLAFALEQALFARRYNVYVLDGDNMRHGLSADLGFSPVERSENIRRIGEVAALFADAGVIVLTAFISPYRADRRRARDACGDAFHEVFLSADLDACERRDPRGLYSRARRGEIPEFTGITAPYEIPENPELIVDTGRQSISDCLERVAAYAERAFVFGSSTIGKPAEIVR